MPAVRTWSPSTDTPELPWFAHPGVRLAVVPESVTVSVTISLLVYWMLTGLNTFWGKVDALSAALGLNNPCKIAWNATRMSWLCEYFVNTKPVFDRLAGQPFKGTMEVRAAWTSVKTQFLLLIESGQDIGPCIYGPHGWTLNGAYVVTLYERTPGVLMTDQELLSCNLSAQQMGILAALAESRLHWDQSKWTKWAARSWSPFFSSVRKNPGWKIPPKWFRRMFKKR